MASETDMRRHSVLDPRSGTASLKTKLSVPRKSLGDELFNSNPADKQPGPSDENGSGSGRGTSSDVARGADLGSSSAGPDRPSMSASAASLGRPSDDPSDRPDSPPVQDETPKHRRFSMLRFRNASDSQLSVRMRQQQFGEKPPPMPQPPAIITTAPTMESATSQKKPRYKLPLKLRRSGEMSRSSVDVSLQAGPNKKDRRKSTAGPIEELLEAPASSSGSRQLVTFQESRPRPHSSKSHPGPPPYADDRGSALALPVNRLSESERSETSSGDHSGVYGSTTTTTHTVSTTTTFFRLPRRKRKQPELFPLSHLPQRSETPGLGPAVSTSSLSNAPGPGRSTPGPSQSHGLSVRAPPSPATALFRPSSRNSGQSSPTRAQLALRGRSSTMSSLGRNSAEDPQLPGTTRTSSSTGRKSFGDLLGLSRLRHGQDSGRHGSLTPATPGSNTSKNNSLQLTRERESIVLPERREDDTPAKYLARLEEVLSRGVIASALSKGTDPFSASVLRSYMRTFGFFEEPMDMAIRKLLMEAELPKETQQIDRCLQAFANRYHECNPGIYPNPDQAYFIAFSLLILHTDVFNKNNKYKMQKTDYLKNTQGEGVFDDVLECFYDNITYTPFIHVEDDLDINGERIVGHKARKKVIFPNGSQEPPRKAKDPIDPYTLILDGKLDTLRPPLKDQIPLEEQYNYVGTAKGLNVRELQKTFFKTGVLQIVSARSRPDAFMTEKTLSNPQEAEPGIVDIKITKVGTLWRKDAKKKKTRSPWQEWGAILTGAQLYFFRNTAWVKSLVHQYETHVRSGHDGIPLIFKPPLENFKPDALMSTDGAVALLDQTYKKHKNAFIYVRHGGFEEVLLAHDEDDRNDWLAKLNYAAAFRTSGVRMRGVVGGSYEGQGRRAIRRLDSSEVTQVIQTPTGEVSINRSRIDQQMAKDILAARRDMMTDRIRDAEDKLQVAQKQLDAQLRNARHLLILAPIQEKTRDQVRAGAAKVIAQLKWSRTEIWRLKCHRDILLLDLEEDQQSNEDLDGHEEQAGPASEKPTLNHKESKSSSYRATRLSSQPPALLALTRSSGSLKQSESESPPFENFQTPPTSATATAFRRASGSRETVPPTLDDLASRKTSVSSAASSFSALPSTPSRHARVQTSDSERGHLDDRAEEDAGERRVLEQAGLLDVEPSHTPERPGSAKTHEELFDRQKRAVLSAGDKDKADRNKLRRSLQRTLRESTGHLSHHRSRKGKDSASSAAMSDDTVREDVLSRGTGSFTVHGKKASVIQFGPDLHGISSDERIRQRKQSQVDEQLLSSAGTENDFQSLLDETSPAQERRESGASASTATARSFRQLHRKYSSAQNAHRNAAGSLVVPSDDDSDAALSFSDGRRTPLPPLEDGSGDESETNDQERSLTARQTRYFTPEQSNSPVDVADEKDEDVEVPQHQPSERLSPPLQTVNA